MEVTELCVFVCRSVGVWSGCNRIICVLFEGVWEFEELCVIVCRHMGGWRGCNRDVCVSLQMRVRVVSCVCQFADVWEVEWM